MRWTEGEVFVLRYVKSCSEYKTMIVLLRLFSYLPTNNFRLLFPPSRQRLYPFSKQFLATATRNLRFSASFGKRMLSLTVHIPSSFFTLAHGGLLLFCSFLTTSTATGIVSIDAGVMSLYSAATCLVLALWDLHPFKIRVSTSTKTFFQLSI